MQLYQRSILPKPQLEIVSLETGGVDLKDISKLVYIQFLMMIGALA